MLKKTRAGYGYSTEFPDMDFETYSEAGYRWVPELQKWKSVMRSTSSNPPRGIAAVGAPMYAEHPTCEVLSLAYNLKDGLGHRLWVPGMPPPTDLFDHIKSGGIIEAWNSAFEFHVWHNVCHKRMGWIELPLQQLRDAAAKSRAFSLPGALAKAAKAIGAENQKITDGTRLLNKFSVPRNPSKNDGRTRIFPMDDLGDASKLYEYNIGDIVAEASTSKKLPDLSEFETTVWLIDQQINNRGVKIDTESLRACGKIVDDVTVLYTAELPVITKGAVNSAGEIKRIVDWMTTQDIHTKSIDAENIERLLSSELPDNVRRVLEIRQIIGSASVKKLDAISRRLTESGRLKDTFMYCGADRTGRWAGRGPQPHNLPNSGPSVSQCPLCGGYFSDKLTGCPWCGNTDIVSADWGIESVECALKIIKTGHHHLVSKIYGDPIKAVSGCLRGLFCADDGNDLICSDYSAIEAVVLAALAREQWRMDIFRTHGKIYEMSASKITGVPFKEFLEYRKLNGTHHPLRKKIGKVAELASGYQGWVGAWKQFGADKHFNSDDEIKKAIISWRNDSPNIVNFWKDTETAAISAVQYPGKYFSVNGMHFGVLDDVLYIQLLSGRKLCYHAPRVGMETTPWGEQRLKLSYMGANKSLKGPKGWLRLDTYGGKLVENIVQATARDILAHAVVNLENAKYYIVLHIHDEIVAEIKKDFGSIEEFESIMSLPPAWCADWPIRATGGWRGHRYRKD